MKVGKTEYALAQKWGIWKAELLDSWSAGLTAHSKVEKKVAERAGLKAASRAAETAALKGSQMDATMAVSRAAKTAASKGIQMDVKTAE